MVYQIKYKNFNKKAVSLTSSGFSLMELIIVIGILSLFLAVSSSGFSIFKSHSNLEITTNGVVEAIRLAESSAQSGKGDSKWGVEILSNQVVIFKGDTYASRNASFDEFFNFPGGISASGLAEIVFEKITGKTANVGDISILNSYGEQKLTINSYGIINYGQLILNTTNVVPTVTTPNVTSIGTTTATLGANVTDLGIPASISDRGTCWGTLSLPTTNCTAEGGTTTGIFTQVFTGLTAGTLYYYRGYATNSTGTAYSPDGTFTTLSYPIPMSKWNFNEGSGCVANDLYGGNNGTLATNCPTISPSWVVGKIGNALNFNGTSNNVLVNDSVNLNFTTSMSVSAWIKWNIVPSTGAAYATIVNKNGDSQYRLQHNVTNSKFEFGIKTNGGDTYITSLTSPVVGVWYHLVGTWDGNLIKLYVNGVLEKTGTRTGTIPSSIVPLKIGSSSLDARWFNGIIDEVNLWNKALTQEEVTQVYSSNL